MTTAYLQELGEAIALLRGRQSQTSAARRAGISRSSWSLYEQGRRRPRDGNLQKVLQALGCTREQLDAAVRKVHNRRLLNEAMELGHWPPGAVLIHQPAQARAAPGARSAGRPPAATQPAADALPRELRDILARQVALLEEFLTYLIHNRL